MDERTVRVYDDLAARIAAGYAAVTPGPLHALVLRSFRPGGRTLDVGSGSGRDAAWLAAEGFPVEGVDASRGMVEEAQRRHTSLRFAVAALPELAGVEAGVYDNVLAAAVLMHLPREALGRAVERLVALLAPGGCLVVSVRKSRDVGEREADGRLFTALGADDVRALLEAAGAVVAAIEEHRDAERTDVRWVAAAARKAPLVP